MLKHWIDTIKKFVSRPLAKLDRPAPSFFITWEESNEVWGTSAYWDDVYTNLLTNSDDYWLKVYKYRSLRLFDMALSWLDTENIRQVLVAGCGISLTPHVLAYRGYEVTAIDISSVAIEFLRQQQPDEEELARCVETLDGAIIVSDIERTLPLLQSQKKAGGKVEFLAADWNSEALAPESYDLIYCCNGFRGATEAQVTEAAHSFYGCLRPGGLLFTEDVNAVPKRDRADEILKETGFVLLRGKGECESDKKYALSFWWSG